MPESREEDFLGNNAFSLCNLYGNAIASEVMKFTISVGPSLIIITKHLVCMDHTPE